MKKKVSYVSILVCCVAAFAAVNMVFTGQASADQTKPTTGCWCCKNGTVIFVQGDIPCSEKGINCFENREDAVEFCKKINNVKGKIQEIKDLNADRPKKENRVWCCVDGKIAYIPEEQCKQASEIYFEKRKDAVEACGKGGGWCCSDGKLVFTTKERCNKKKDSTFYETLDDALSDCKGINVEMLCYCCKNGEYEQSTVEDCLKKRGYPFLTKAMAEEYCGRPIKLDKEDTVIPGKGRKK
jgi:hypothetical protein